MTGNYRTFLPLALALAAALSWAPLASADSAAAEALFERGKELMQAGKIAEACAKFEESFRLDPGGGVLMNLATCHEKQGRTATAWAEYKEALAMATKANRPDRESFARERIEALLPFLSRLKIEVPPEAQAQPIEVRKAGQPLGKGSWGEALPTDPGKIWVVVSAQGFVERRYEVDLKPGESVSLRIEPLAPVPSTPASSAPAPPPPPAVSAQPSAPPLASQAPPSDNFFTRKNTGLLVGGAGLLSLAVGGVFGARAVLKRQESDPECPGGACSARGWSLYEQAQTSASVANVGVGLGLVGLGVGAFLLLTPGSETSVSVGPGSLSLRRRW